MGLPENIDALLVKFDLTAEGLARLVGVTPAAVSGWRHGKSIRSENLKVLVEKFNLTNDDILSENNGLAAKEHGTYSFQGARRSIGMEMGLAPRRFQAHAGILDTPDTFDEEELVSIPQFLIDKDKDSFVVSTIGDCMDKVFAPSSDLVVSPNKIPQNGSIVLASVNNEEFIIRRYHKTTSTVILSPESHNTDYKDIVITYDSEDSLYISGVITWFQSEKEME